MLRIEEAGPLTLVQDRGRPGSMHLGVPSSGALDPEALALANRLVGNPAEAAGLEIVLGGLAMRPERSVRIAVTGAQVGLRVGGRAASWGTAESVRAGERIEIVAADAGLRCWLALSGGIDVPLVLGSRSTDTLSGLGPPPVEAGTALALGRPPDAARSTGAVEELSEAEVAAVPVRWAEVVTLPLAPGPRDDWFTEASLERLLEHDYVVAQDSNRTAVRLLGEEPLERTVTDELPSEGLVNGAVQVPASGQPLVFLADHPVTGGYPVVGVVTESGLAACAQARPGDRVRFRRLRSGPGR